MRSFVGLRGLSLALVFTVFFTAGCAENSAMRIEMERLSSNLGDLRNLQASQTTQLAAIEGQLRQVIGRVEELEHSQNTHLSSDLSSLKNDLSNLQRRVPPPPIVPASALDEDESNLSAVPSEISSALGEGYRSLRNGDFTTALARFKEAYDLSYGKEVSALPGFWIGVAYDGLGNNREALGAYHDMTSKFPKHPRVPLALLRQGSVLVRLGDSKTAALTFKKIISDYPKSNEADRAKERLKDLA